MAWNIVLSDLPTVVPVTITPSVGGLAMTGVSGSALSSIGLAPNTATLAVSGKAPSLNAGINTPAPAPLLFVPTAPALHRVNNIFPPAASLIYAPQTPSVVTSGGGGGGFTFAPNLPAGYTQIWKRVFNKTDSVLGTLPPATFSNGQRDQYGMAWLNGDSTTARPLIDTPANLTPIVGRTITTPPDGNSTVLAVNYPTGYPFAQCPFFLSPNAFSGFNKLYACFLVFIPSNFSTDGNNIKWLDCDAGVSNDIFMLIAGNGGTGANADNRMVWQTLQGPVSGNPGGAGGGPAGATIRAQLTPTNPPPQGTGPGWMNSMLDQWIMCEWLADITNGRLQTWVTQAPYTTPFLINDFSFSYGIVANSWNNATFCPYHGGGGGAASANMFIMVSECGAFGSN